eukprot:s3589_g2.t1
MYIRNALKYEIVKSCLLCAGTLGGSGFAEQPVGCNETTAQPDFCATPRLDHSNFERCHNSHLTLDQPLSVDAVTQHCACLAVTILERV